jgi:Flp pilus assembly protein TadG
MRMRYSNLPSTGLRLTSGQTSRRRRRQGGSIVMMFTLMLPFVLIPLVGLAIDATMLYTVKVKMQSAVDGGALAAAASLSAGLSITAQMQAATLATDEFMRANIGSSFWGAYNLNDSSCGASVTDGSGVAQAPGAPTVTANPPRISYTNSGNCIIIYQDNVNKQRTVAIQANVQVPLLFMRILGFSNGTVTSYATAARRDVVLVLVIDRSSSMNNTINGVQVITTLQQAATTNFVDQFQSNTDKLGLVVFGGSALVAYPPADWNNGTANPVGPSVSFATDTPNMDTLINSIVVGSNTNTAEALTLAYKELVAANEPGALNIIVLFTDGQPNGLTANFNDSTGAGNGTAASIIKNTFCTNNSVLPTTPTSAKSMIGWMAQWGGYAAGGTTDTNGIFTLAQNSGTSVTNWLNGTSFVNGQEPVLAPGPPNGGLGQAGAGPATKCDLEAPDPNTETTKGNINTAKGTITSNISSDISSFPKADLYGDLTLGTTYTIPGTGSGAYTTNDYKQSSIWNGNSTSQMCNNGKRPAGISLTSTLGDACQFGLASWNAADMAAKNIHTDAHGLKPIIYALGFEGNGGDDPAFMQRLANCAPGVPCVNGGANATNTAYWANQPSGMYLPIATPGDIAPALQTVLAEILRLSQ